MKSRLQSLFEILLILIAGGALGFTLLILVYNIPVDNIINHLSDAHIYIQETSQYEYAPGYKGAILDNTTDAIMLSEASYNSDNAVKDASLVPRISYAGSDPVFSLLGIVNRDAERESYLEYYPRYWHGYLILLKPFLYFFDFSDMRMFNLAVSFFVSMMFVIAMYRNDIFKRYVPAAISMLIFWNIASVGLCIQYTACFYISLLASIYIISSNNIGTLDFKIHILFLIIGMLTSYFDFLTYPIATLGLPLALYLLRMKSLNFSERDSCIHEIFTIIKLSSAWSIGYIGFWFEKWLIGSFFTEYNVLLDATNQIITRAGNSIDENGITELSRIEIVISLLKMSLAKWLYIFLLSIVIIYILFSFYKENKGYKIYNKLEFIKNRLSLLIVGFFPIAWFFLAANHSYIHPRLVYRGLGVMLFSWISLLLIPLKISSTPHTDTGQILKSKQK